MHLSEATNHHKNSTPSPDPHPHRNLLLHTSCATRAPPPCAPYTHTGTGNSANPTCKSLSAVSRMSSAKRDRKSTQTCICAALKAQLYTTDRTITRISTQHLVWCLIRHSCDYLTIDHNTVPGGCPCASLCRTTLPLRCLPAAPGSMMSAMMPATFLSAPLPTGRLPLRLLTAAAPAPTLGSVFGTATSLRLRTRFTTEVYCILKGLPGCSGLRSP